MYHLEFIQKAEDTLARLDISIARRIRRKLEQLCEHCDTYPHKALKGKDRGKFSLRMQNYRIIYTFNRQKREVTVHRIGHRSNVY
ncbi:type II toxin-antitoxin system RelE/ParE family toxin [Candidatus Poribacteria bacterium]|nr:type II toxin-antitoxin system RelE/ParE family toxin [Candidatus Poribacteria bacterium]MYB64723.1 type II toxin-antitoxin system RelE/ParE family toxin [Candidatus Poribacteria bacterium]